MFVHRFLSALKVRGQNEWKNSMNRMRARQKELQLIRVYFCHLFLPHTHTLDRQIGCVIGTRWAHYGPISSIAYWWPKERERDFFWFMIERKRFTRIIFFKNYKTILFYMCDDGFMEMMVFSMLWNCSFSADKKMMSWRYRTRRQYYTHTHSTHSTTCLHSIAILCIHSEWQKNGIYRYRKSP